jgi:hypothetical protein
MSSKEGRHLLTAILKPVADRILAVIPGNHDSRLTKSTGSDEVDSLMCALGIGDRYFPEGECFLQLRVGCEDHRAKSAPVPVIYRLYMTHGASGGRLHGASANGLMALRNIVHNADAYFTGHSHKPMVIPDVALEFTRDGKINERHQIFVSCGASLTRGGYGVAKAYPSLARVYPTITFHGDHKHMSASIEH